MFKKIKEITGKRSAPTSKCIKAADGTVLYKYAEVADRWVEYIHDLFDDDEEPEEVQRTSAQTGPSIMKDEMRWALKRMKRSKISMEMLLALDDEGIDILWQLCTEIYKTGIFPKQMLLSIFICLPKIQVTIDCANHRTISLMRQILKILLKIIFQRIRRQLLPEISEHQCGVMRGIWNASSRCSQNRV